MTPSTIPAIEAGDRLLMTEGGVSIRSLVATEDVGPGTVAISQLISFGEIATVICTWPLFT